MRDNKLVRVLRYVTGLVNQELLLQNEYLAAENRILGALAGSIAPIRSRTIHARRDRKKARAQSS